MLCVDHVVNLRARMFPPLGYVRLASKNRKHRGLPQIFLSSTVNIPLPLPLQIRLRSNCGKVPILPVQSQTFEDHLSLVPTAGYHWIGALGFCRWSAEGIFHHASWRQHSGSTSTSCNFVYRMPQTAEKGKISFYKFRSDRWVLADCSALKANPAGTVPGDFHQ